MIDQLHCSDIQRYQMEFESGVTRINIDKLHSWYIQEYEMEGEIGVT